MNDEEITLPENFKKWFSTLQRAILVDGKVVLEPDIIKWTMWMAESPDQHPGPHVEIFLYINSSSQVALYSNPNMVDSIATSFYAEATLTLRQVPEPNSISLLVFGCLLLATAVRLLPRQSRRLSISAQGGS